MELRRRLIVALGESSVLAGWLASDMRDTTADAISMTSQIARHEKPTTPAYAGYSVRMIVMTGIEPGRRQSCPR